MAYGWTVDRDHETQSNTVHFYIDGAAGQGGTIIGAATANVPRPDVPYPGNHGFEFNIPAQYRDGNPHTLYAYGIDLNGDGNTLLLGSPKTFTLSPNIQSVTFKPTVDCSNPNTNGCLSNNPGNGNENTNIGQRIFPDRIDSSDGINRRKVKIEANAGVPNVMIYFRNYDPDDPSFNEAPVDPTGSGGDDNRTALPSDPKAGWLTCPAGSTPSICNPQANGVAAKTDANGIAVAELTLTIQPGNNFMVAASADESYANGITVSGIQLQDSSGAVIPDGTSSEGSKARRTDMLTVWRRLHIEYDAMGLIQNNNLGGKFLDGAVVGVNPVTIEFQPTVKSFNEHQFQNGLLSLINQSLIVDDNTIDSSLPTVKYFVDVRRMTGTTTVNANQTFSMYDDDNFNYTNGSAGSPGDEGEYVTELPETFSLMQDHDDINNNRFAIAYIRPNYSWARSKNYNQNDIPFVRNFDDSDPVAVEDQTRRWKNSGNDERDDFWVAYIQLAYQGKLDNDNDPNSEKARFGVSGFGSVDDDPPTDPMIPYPDGKDGALLYMETMTDGDRQEEGFPLRFYYKQTTAVHETGHQMGLAGDHTPNLGIMSYGDYSTHFRPRHINLMRLKVRSPGG